MQTTKGKTCTFIHYSDFKATVTIRALAEHGMGMVEMDVDAEDLLMFAATAVRNKKIADLEQATDEEILGL